MGLTTSYSKAESDLQIQQLKQIFGTGIYEKPLHIADSVPTEYGGYVLADVGAYSFGTTLANKYNVGFLSASGWEIVSIDMPQATKNIPQFANLSFPVTNTATEKVQCVENFVAYQLLDGKTSTSANTPSTSPTIWKPLENRNLRIYEDIPNGTILNPKEQVISNNVQYIVLDTAVVGTDLPTGTKFESLEKENFFLTNKISENKNYHIFNITTDNVWYYTEKIPTFQGMVFNYKGFAKEPIGEIFDEDGVKIANLPSGNSLSVINHISYTAGNKGYIHFKSANFGGNAFEDSELSWSKNKVYAEENELENIYEKKQIIGAGVQGVGLSSNQPFGDLSFQSKYYLEKSNIAEQSFVKTIEMYAQNSGVITFAFGIIDQFGVFIERENFSFNIASEGNQTYNVNRYRKENEYIAIKCPITNGMTWKDNPNGTGNIWDSGNNYSNPLVRTTNYDMAWRIDYDIVKDNPLAFADDLQNIEERVLTLENKQLTIFDSVTGEPYTIAVVNGVLTPKSLLFNKIAHIGNSICIHPITSFWWGLWGMAATIRANDYVHKFLTKYQVINPSATTEALNIATWEQNPNTYNKANMDATLQDADLVTVSIGENVSYSANFEDDFTELIDYIKTKRPLATILICGQFWENSQKETVIQNVANQFGLTFISFAGTDNSNYKNTVNTQVYGDDNQWHLISEGGATAQGVADHPNDLWFELKANKLMNALGL